MIVTKLVSGLGNQLFQYVVGRRLATKWNVPLKLDNAFFGSQNLRSFKLNHYQIEAGVANDGDIKPFCKEIERYNNLHQKTTLAAKIYRRSEPVLFPKHTKNYFKEATWWIYEPEVFKCGPETYLEGYWQHYKYYEDVSTKILDELSLKDKNDQSRNTWLNKIESEAETVAIHVRRGDYVTDVNANYLMGVLPLSYYNDAIAYLKQKLSNPVFYFFSDDLPWVKQHIDTGKNSTFYVEGNTDYVDLDLMARCKHNIIANSTFSWWGAFLNRNQNKIVIAPKVWSPRPDVNASIKLQLPSWIKL